VYNEGTKEAKEETVSDKLARMIEAEVLDTSPDPEAEYPEVPEYLYCPFCELEH
jgi:hypothetical protein